MSRTLIEEVMAGELAIVDNLLNSGADVNQSDDQGWTPLNFAAGKGDLPMVKLLVEKGADPFKVGRDSRTPYMIALAAGRVDVAKYLREVEDRINPERARFLRPERKYCKAYYLKDLQKFAGWSESRTNWKTKKDQQENGELSADEFPENKVVFIHQDFKVTESALHDENVIFSQVSEEWRKFCSNTLKFTVPTDLDLIIPNSIENEA